MEPILLIGGTSGVGKTTLARQLSYAFPFHQRISTGFIREILKIQTSVEDEAYLYSYTFDSTTPIHHINNQADRIFESVAACINRAQQEGTSLVIEGTHLLPSLYANIPNAFLIILEAPSVDEHLTRIQSETHSKRRITEEQFSNAQTINDYYHHQAHNYSVPLLQFNDNLAEFIELLNWKFQAKS